MYLRTTRRTNKDGSVVEYYQLAHNERHPVTGKPVARIIHSFGRADELDRDHLVRLCHSIARVCGLQVIDPLSDTDDGALDSSLGLPKDLKLIRTLALGTALAIEGLWERLGIGQMFRDICKACNLKVPYERALLALVANRLCEPESKLGVWDRWLQKVYMPSCDSLKLEQMYEAMDLFYEHVAELEEHIFFQTANLLNLQVDLVFYDTTTASFSIDYEDEETSAGAIRKFGHCKEGGWGPQVVVALAVTREGLPVRSWVLPGNTTDVTTVKRVRTDLRGWTLGRAIFVADSGMNSEENRQELSRACGKYLLATRMANVAEVKRHVLTKRGRYTVIKDNLHAKEVIVGDGERRRRYILCYNPKEAERQKKHREQIVTFLEKELERHPSRKATAQWAIDLLASQRYKRYLTITKGNNIRIDRKSIREAKKYDGKWVLETNDDTISVEDAACGYKGLMIIERCFRSLKRTQIKMTPMFHWVPRRIETHVKICILALLIERVAEISCGEPWSRIRRKLDELQISQFHTPEYRFFRRNEISAKTSNLLKSLNISTPKMLVGLEKLQKSTSEM
jgi:transposase